MSPSLNEIINLMLTRGVLTVPAIELTRARDDWSIGWSVDWRIIVEIESLWIHEDWSTIHWIASMLKYLLFIIIKNYKIILSTLIGIASWTFSMFNLLYNQGTLKWHIRGRSNLWEEIIVAADSLRVITDTDSNVFHLEMGDGRPSTHARLLHAHIFHTPY